MTTPDLLLRIKRSAQALRDQKLEITDLEERLSQAKQRLIAIQQNDLPDLMAQAGVPKLTIAAEGNLPAYTIQVKPFARANIAASWPEEKKEEAFDWLESHGHGDLIKTTITLEIPKDQRAEAVDLITSLQRQGHTPHVEEAVHFMTLSKWLREMVKQGQMVPLDIIGGTVGTEAVIKEAD